ALVDEALDDPVAHHAVVEVATGQGHEVVHGDGGLVGRQLHRHGAGVEVDGGRVVLGRVDAALEGVLEGGDAAAGIGGGAGCRPEGGGRGRGRRGGNGGGRLGRDLGGLLAPEDPQGGGHGGDDGGHHGDADGVAALDARVVGG